MFQLLPSDLELARCSFAAETMDAIDPKHGYPPISNTTKCAVDDPVSLYDAYIGVLKRDRDIPCDGSCRVETCPYITPDLNTLIPAPPIVHTDRHPAVSPSPYTIHGPAVTNDVPYVSETSQIPRKVPNALYWSPPPPIHPEYTQTYVTASYPTAVNTMGISYYDAQYQSLHQPQGSPYESLHRNYIANTSTTPAPIQPVQYTPVKVGYYKGRKSPVTPPDNPEEGDKYMVCSFHMDFIPKLGNLSKYLSDFGVVTNKVEIEWDCLYGGGPNIDGPIKGVPIAKIRFNLAESAQKVCDKAKTHTIPSGIKFRAYRSMKHYVNSYNKNKNKKKKQKK